MKIHRLLIGLIVVLLAGIASAETPIVVKFSHVVAAATPKGKAALFFKRRAEQLTHGQVRVEVYPESSLYKDKEELEALQLGAVQMIAPSLAKFGPLGIRQFEVFDLPYIFDSYQDLHKVTDGPIGKSLLDMLEGKGILGLAFWDNGFKVMSANRPLRAPEDFVGLKMRIQPSSVLDAQMRALGALPRNMAFSEVYQALQAGVVDGTENPPSNLYTKRMYEVQKYVTVSNHGYLGYAVLVNKKFWDGLPADLRSALERAMAEATRYADEIAKAENEMALDQVRKSGKCQIIELTADQKRAWKRALIGVHAEMAGRIGAALIQSIYRETGFDPAKL